MHAAIKALILDMDGVLWRDAEPIGDLPAIFRQIQAAGLKVLMATNNASRSPAQHLERLHGFGVTGLDPWQVVNSAEAVAALLKQRYPQGGDVYIVGEPPLIEILAAAGFYQVKDTSQTSSVLAVVGSIDRRITYDKLKEATRLIYAGALFVGTNPDRTFPTPQGLVPGSGAILAALTAATYQEPLFAGKPSPLMYQLALERLGVGPHETLVVGDRAETDIAGAQALGCRTALVLSGVTDAIQAAQWQPAPDIIAADLAEVVRQITQ